MWPGGDAQVTVAARSKQLDDVSVGVRWPYRVGYTARAGVREYQHLVDVRARYCEDYIDDLYGRDMQEQ
jgi:hypothetical protein